MNFKVGDKVKVVKRAENKLLSWVYSMNQTIGNTYIIMSIGSYGNVKGTYKIQTETGIWYYLPESLKKVSVKGEQLLFSFMND